MLFPLTLTIIPSSFKIHNRLRRLNSGHLCSMSHEERRSTEAVTSDEGTRPGYSSSGPVPPQQDVASDETIRLASEHIEGCVKSDGNPESSQISGTLSDASEEERRPPLPPRPSNLSLLQDGNHSSGQSLHVPKRSVRPNLQSTATTALSRTDIHTQSYPDGSRETTASLAQTTPPPKSFGFNSIRKFKGLNDSDSASIKSYAPTLEAGGDVESLLGEVLAGSQDIPPWDVRNPQALAQDTLDLNADDDDEVTADFYREFDEIHEVDVDEDNEGNAFWILI